MTKKLKIEKIIREMIDLAKDQGRVPSCIRMSSHFHGLLLAEINFFEKVSYEITDFGIHLENVVNFRKITNYLCLPVEIDESVTIFIDWE